MSSCKPKLSLEEKELAHITKCCGHSRTKERVNKLVSDPDVKKNHWNFRRFS